MGAGRAFDVFRAALVGFDSNVEDVPVEPIFDREVLLNLTRGLLTISGANMGNEGAASIWAD